LYILKLYLIFNFLINSSLIFLFPYVSIFYLAYLFCCYIFNFLNYFSFLCIYFIYVFCFLFIFITYVFIIFLYYFIIRYLFVSISLFKSDFFIDLIKSNWLIVASLFNY